MLPEIWLPNLRFFLVTYLFHICSFYLMKLTETHHFYVHKALLSNYFNKAHCATSFHPDAGCIVSVQVRTFSLSMRNRIIYAAR